MEESKNPSVYPIFRPTKKATLKGHTNMAEQPTAQANPKPPTKAQKKKADDRTKQRQIDDCIESAIKRDRRWSWDLAEWMFEELGDFIKEVGPSFFHPDQNQTWVSRGLAKIFQDSLRESRYGNKAEKREAQKIRAMLRFIKEYNIHHHPHFRRVDFFYFEGLFRLDGRCTTCIEENDHLYFFNRQWEKKTSW